MKTSTLVEIAIGVLAVAVSAYFLVKHFLHSPGPAPAPSPTPGPPTPPSGPTGATGPCPAPQLSIPGGGCAEPCGDRGYCLVDSQACVEVTNPDCDSKNAPLADKKYSCSQGSSQEKYSDCVISCDSKGSKKAYLCASNTVRNCYNTSKVQSLPPKVGDKPPLYNVTAWAENLTTCDGAPEEPIDTFCDYSGTQVARTQMTDLFKAYVLKYTDSPSPDTDPVVATLKDFRQSSYQMRQSPLGYACLPVGSSGTVGTRPQGYRYINFPLASDYDKNSCTVVDCLHTALSNDVERVYYDDGNHACMAVVCEGDGCTPMSPSVPSSGPSRKLASGDRYCKQPSPSEPLDTFKDNNCPQETIEDDCLPDSDQDSVVEKVYQQNGLQFWKPGQRDINFCVTNNMGDDIVAGQWDGTTNVWPMYCDKSPAGQCNEQVDTAGLQPIDYKKNKCLTRNVLDYLDRRVWLTAQGNFPGWSAYMHEADNSALESITVSEEYSDAFRSYSRNILWHLNDEPSEATGKGNWSAGLCKSLDPNVC